MCLGSFTRQLDSPYLTAFYTYGANDPKSIPVEHLGKTKSQQYRKSSEFQASEIVGLVFPFPNLYGYNVPVIKAQIF